MNVLKPDKINTIITLSKNGVSQREIFRRTTIDRKTIRKYSLQSDQIPQVDLNSKSSTPTTGSDSKSPTLVTGSDDKISENPLPLSSIQNEPKVPSHAKSACEPHRKWISDTANIDFTTIPYWGDDSHLENNWSGTRNKALASISAVLAQDPDSGIITYGDTNIRHDQHSDVAVEFLDFYNS